MDQKAIRTIIIGRDTSSHRLTFTVDGQPVMAATRLPLCVSRQHARLTVYPDGRLTLDNLNPDNDTFVDGHAIEHKTIAEGQRIELGAERVALKWDKTELGGLLPRFADIRPLEAIWNDYDRATLDIEVSERRFNALRMVTIFGSVASMALGAFGVSRDSWVIYVPSIVVLIVSLLFMLKSFRDAKRIPQLRRTLRSEAELSHRCPACGKLLPLQDYRKTCLQDQCPHCKAYFIK